MSESEPGPLRPGRTEKFEQDLERCRKRGLDMDLARVVMGRLIYRIDGNEIILESTGTRSDLFDE